VAAMIGRAETDLFSWKFSSFGREKIRLSCNSYRQMGSKLPNLLRKSPKLNRLRILFHSVEYLQATNFGIIDAGEVSGSPCPRLVISVDNSQEAIRSLFWPLA